MPSEARALQHHQPTRERALAAVSARDVRKVYGDGQIQVIAVDNVSVAFGKDSFTEIIAPPGHASAGGPKDSRSKMRILSVILPRHLYLCL